MALKSFYIISGLWLVVLLLRDSGSRLEDHVTNLAFLFLLLLVLAVRGLSERMDRAVRQIRDPDFDDKAERRKEWLEVGQWVFAVLAIFVVGLAAQGVIRCANSGDAISFECVLNGIWDQYADDTD